MLEGKNILLRPIREEDIEKFYIWRNNIEIKNDALMHPFPVTIHQEKEWFQKIALSKDNRLIFLGIEYKETHELIGFVKLFDINWINQNCYFGIVIGNQSFHGKGLGKEATKLIIEYAFKNLNLKKILLEVVDINIKAIKLYKKLGFDEEGLLKRQVMIDGKWKNVLIMSLFKNEEI